MEFKCYAAEIMTLCGLHFGKVVFSRLWKKRYRDASVKVGKEETGSLWSRQETMEWPIPVSMTCRPSVPLRPHPTHKLLPSFFPL